MKCINFDERFADFVSAWTSAHQADYPTFDEMEEDIPNIYNHFLNTPAQWLEGITPGAYFTQYEDPKLLVDWLITYMVKGVPVPDLLMDQIQFVGKPCEKRLVALLQTPNATDEMKMTAIGLLREMDSDKPKMLYINMQLDRTAKDEVADNAIDSLKQMGKIAVQPILDVINRANPAGQEALLDVLSDFPGDERIYHVAIKLFREQKERQALLAGYLGKLGDDRALPDLMEAAEADDLRYLDFIELRSAIEQLGGTAPEREFESDPDYEALFGTDAE